MAVEQIQHVFSSGTAVFMSWGGRPNCDRICAFGEEMFALDFLRAKYSTQWCRGMWLTPRRIRLKTWRMRLKSWRDQRKANVPISERFGQPTDEAGVFAPNLPRRNLIADRWKITG